MATEQVGRSLRLSLSQRRFSGTDYLSKDARPFQAPTTSVKTRRRFHAEAREQRAAAIARLEDGNVPVHRKARSSAAPKHRNARSSATPMLRNARTHRNA